MSEELNIHLPTPEEELLHRKKKLMKVVVVTPEGEVFNSYAKSVNAYSPLGSFRILYNHAPMVSFIVAKNIEIGTENGKVIIEPSSGILEVLDNNIKIALEKAKVLK